MRTPVIYNLSTASLVLAMFVMVFMPAMGPATHCSSG